MSDVFPTPDASAQPLRFRKLRIAAFICSLLMGLTLVNFSAQSYHRAAGFEFMSSLHRKCAVVSMLGELGVALTGEAVNLGVSHNEKLEVGDWPHDIVMKIAYPRVTGKHLPFDPGFHWKSARYSFYAGVPYWFLTLLCVLSAAAC